MRVEKDGKHFAIIGGKRITKFYNTKQELSEGEEGLKYWKNTEKNIATISEMVNQLNNKIKNLHQ